MTAHEPSYKRATLQDHWDAIVIGSGIGALTPAAMLARNGWQRFAARISSDRFALSFVRSSVKLIGPNDLSPPDVKRARRV